MNALLLKTALQPHTYPEDYMPNNMDYIDEQTPPPESEKSTSSDTSEHLSQNPQSSFSTNQIRDMSGTNQNRDVGDTSGVTLPMKGVVYKYETPSVNNFQTFSSNQNLTGAPGKQQHSEDSGIGEVSVSLKISVF